MPQRVLDPVWVPSVRFWWFNVGYAAVLMFFVLSGYVIGLTTREPATGRAVRGYLARRAWRLVPITTAAVLLSVLLFPHADWRTVLGNLLFLQNDLPYPGLGAFPLLENNPNLWSLNYEVLYYLGFIVLWRTRAPLGAVAALLGLVVAARIGGAPVPEVFGRYAVGALFWLAGLAVAWRTPEVEPGSQRANWAAALFGAFALWTFAPLRTLSYGLDWYPALWATAATPHRLDFLLAAVWLLVAVTGRAPRLRIKLTWICLGLATAAMAAHRAGNWMEADSAGAVSLLLAWGLARAEWRPQLLARLAWLGSISFGLYVIAGPLQLAQRGLFPTLAGSVVTFAVRALFSLGLALAAAWWLERRWSPWCRHRLRRPPDTSAGT